jgi:hypothetical protein
MEQCKNIRADHYICQAFSMHTKMIYFSVAGTSEAQDHGFQFTNDTSLVICDYSIVNAISL